MSGRGTILVVDDVETVLAVTRRMMERSGYAVRTSTTGREARVIAKDEPGLVAILLDSNLADESGEDTARALVAAAPGVPLLVMTGGDTEEVELRFEGLPIAGVIQKPFAPQLIDDILAETVGRRRRAGNGE